MNVPLVVLLALAFVASNGVLIVVMLIRLTLRAPAEAARARWRARYAEVIDDLIMQDREPSGHDIAALIPDNRRQRRVLEAVLAERAGLLRGRARSRMTEVFERTGIVGIALSELVSRRAWNRRIAAEVLGHSRSEQATQDLLLSLRDADDDVRTIAAKALGKIGAADALPFIASLFRDLDEDRCASVADTIVSFGETSHVPREERIAPLVDLLDDSSEKVRYWATHCLASLTRVAQRSKAPETAARLLARLSDPSARVRAEACRAIGSLGLSADAPALESGLADVSAEVRRYSARSLGAIGGAGVLAALIQAMGDPDFDVSREAGRALIALDERGIDAVQGMAGAATGASLRRAMEVLNVAGRVSPL